VLGEGERFLDGGADQRPIFLSFAGPQIFADQNDADPDDPCFAGNLCLLSRSFHK